MTTTTAADRAGLVERRKALLARGEAEGRKLAAAEAEALAELERGRETLAGLERKHDERRRARSSAATAIEAEVRRIEHALRSGDAALVVERAERAIAATGESLRANGLRTVIARRDAGFDSHWSNYVELGRALGSLAALRDRPAELACEVADLERLERELGKLEAEAARLAALVPKEPPKGWPKDRPSPSPLHDEGDDAPPPRVA